MEKMAPDQAKSALFESRLVATLNAGALCLMTSIGHRTGLFDTLAKLPPVTSIDLAREAGLQERYVREWLGAMVAANVVDYDPSSRTYSLPPEHAAYLTRAVEPSNFAVFAQYIPLLGSVEDDIVRCFSVGGGVPYSRFTRFHEVMAEDSGQTILPALKDHILRLIPGLLDRLKAGIRVLDVGCGRGRALNLMAGWFPNSRFVGFDLSEEAISFARREAEDQGHANLTFETRDLSRFDLEAERDTFDFVTTFDAIHDQAKPRALLRGIYRSLAEDGVYLAQDINGSSHVHLDREHPLGTLLYTVSCLHCMTVSLAQGGDGLGAMWGREKAEELMREAGFRSIDVHTLPHDIQNNYYVCHP